MFLVDVVDVAHNRAYKNCDSAKLNGLLRFKAPERHHQWDHQATSTDAGHVGKPDQKWQDKNAAKLPRQHWKNSFMLAQTLIADKIWVFVAVTVDVTRFSVNSVDIIRNLIVNNVVNNVTFLIRTFL